MRKLYFLINLGLLTAAGSLLAANWSYRTPPPDPALKWQPETPAAPAAPVAAAPPHPPPPPDQLRLIRQKNPFSPLRGEEPPKDENMGKGPAAAPRFELVGLCSIGETSGAIIEAQNVGRGGPDANRKRRYYPVGSEVSGGFVLESVAESSAVLKRKNETLELKVSRSRFAAELGRSNRAAPAASTAPAAPVARPQPQPAKAAAARPVPPAAPGPLAVKSDSGAEK